MPRQPAKRALSDNAPKATAPKASRAKVHLPSSLGEVITTRLPRGTSSLPRDVVDKEQRKRLILALAKVVIRKGYTATTLTDITAEAGVSRETFYGLFRDKEDCFLFGYELINSAVMADVAKVSGTATTLTGQMLLGLTAYFQRINADLQLARAFIGEAQAATPATRAAFEKNYAMNKLSFQQWIEAVQQQYPDVQRVSDTEISLVMLGMDGYIMSRIRAGLTFSDEDIAAVHKFTMVGLGMYDVAMKAQ